MNMVCCGMVVEDTIKRTEDKYELLLFREMTISPDQWIQILYCPFCGCKLTEAQKMYDRRMNPVPVYIPEGCDCSDCIPR